MRSPLTPLRGFHTSSWRPQTIIRTASNTSWLGQANQNHGWNHNSINYNEISLFDTYS